jgi:hypothetical protein
MLPLTSQHCIISWRVIALYVPLADSSTHMYILRPCADLVRPGIVYELAVAYSTQLPPDMEVTALSAGQPLVVGGGVAGARSMELD